MFVCAQVLACVDRLVHSGPAPDMRPWVVEVTGSAAAAAAAAAHPRQDLPRLHRDLRPGWPASAPGLAHIRQGGRPQCSLGHRQWSGQADSLWGQREREWVGSAGHSLGGGLAYVSTRSTPCVTRSTLAAGHSLGGGLACLAALDLRIILPPAVQVSARLSRRIGRRALRVCMSVYPCCMYACIGIAIAVPIHPSLCV